MEAAGPAKTQRRSAVDQIAKLSKGEDGAAGLAWNTTLSNLPIPRDFGMGDWGSLNLSSVDLDSKELASSAVDRSSQQQSPDIATRAVAWRDVAQQVGVKFNYFASPTAGAEGKRIFEFGGGGVGPWTTTAMAM